MQKRIERFNYEIRSRLTDSIINKVQCFRWYHLKLIQIDEIKSMRGKIISIQVQIGNRML